MWLLINREGGNDSYCSYRSVMLGFGGASFATVNVNEICSHQVGSMMLTIA